MGEVECGRRRRNANEQADDAQVSRRSLRFRGSGSATIGAARMEGVDREGAQLSDDIGKEKKWSSGGGGRRKKKPDGAGGWASDFWLNQTLESQPSSEGWLGGLTLESH